MAASSCSKTLSLSKIPRCFNQHLFNRNIATLLKKAQDYNTDQISRSAKQINLAKLDERGVFRVSGRDATKLLQGLTTNDINLIADGKTNVVYSHLLDSTGRTLYDAFIYRNNIKELEYLIECDFNLIDEIISHLKKFKLRSKVEFNDATKDISTWAMFWNKPNNQTLVLPNQSISSMIGIPDVRTSILGWRFLTAWNKSPKELISISPTEIMTVDPAVYNEHRYKTGVAEGSTEIEKGSSLPLTYNLDIMNGVSFSKGCYLGQELTARSHHTGVIRKRIVPMEIILPTDFINYPNLIKKCALKSSNNRSLGTLVAISGRYCLGLVRLAEALKSDGIFAESEKGEKIELSMNFPDWWPDGLQY